MVYFHGGGFCLCRLETHDGICRQLALAAHTAVVSVGYALAPEHPFPAAPDDCMAATEWIRANAYALGFDPSRFALVGDSAGGALAAATALRIGATGAPSLRALLLFYPVTDHPSSDMPSYGTRGTGWGLTGEAMRWFWSQYLGPAGADRDDPRASPLRAQDFSSYPPTYVATAEYDPLRDEGAEFAARLRRDAVATTWRHHEDLNHTFLGWAGVITSCTAAFAKAADWLRAALR